MTIEISTTQTLKKILRDYISKSNNCLDKILNMYAGLINIYKLLFSFYKISNSIIEIRK